MWRACERFHILPPGILGTWEDMEVPQHAALIAYDAVRRLEDSEERVQLAQLGVRI